MSTARYLLLYLPEHITFRVPLVFFLFSFFSCVSYGVNNNVQRKWGSSSLADRRLYSAITRRIEGALLALEAEVCIAREV